MRLCNIHRLAGAVDREDEGGLSSHVLLQSHKVSNGTRCEPGIGSSSCVAGTRERMEKNPEPTFVEVRAPIASSSCESRWRKEDALCPGKERQREAQDGAGVWETPSRGTDKRATGLTHRELEERRLPRRGGVGGAGLLASLVDEALLSAMASRLPVAGLTYLDTSRLSSS